MLLDQFARRIREYRERRHLSQREVANLLQVSPQAVSKWERGENAPDIGLLVRLSRLLSVSVDHLLTGGEPDARRFEATVLVSSVMGFTRRCDLLDAQDRHSSANCRPDAQPPCRRAASDKFGAISALTQLQSSSRRGLSAGTNRPASTLTWAASMASSNARRSSPVGAGSARAALSRRSASATRSLRGNSSAC